MLLIEFFTVSRLLHLSGLLLVLLAGGFQLTFSGCSQTSQPAMNFKYDDGEKPWAKHIKTDVNTTYSKVLRVNPYLKQFACNGSAAGHPADSAFPIKMVCLHGNGAKMIVPVPPYDPKPSQYVFVSPHDSGFLEAEHHSRMIPAYYYDPECKFYQKFFVVPFDDYEIPTCYPIEASRYLPIWKESLQRLNGFDDRYFNRHFVVYGATVEKWLIEDKEELRFLVTYYYVVDWVRIRLIDCIVFGVEDIGYGVTADELLHDNGRLPEETKYGRTNGVRRIDPVEHIQPKRKIAANVKAASPLLGFDINRNLQINNIDGQLTLELWGTKNYEANQCVHAYIGLATGKVTPVENMACWVY